MVMAMMLIITAPGILRLMQMAVEMIPSTTSKTSGSRKLPMVTKVAGSETTSSPFFRPMKAMKSPMPQVIASLNSRGMASTSMRRAPVIESRKKITPL